jgi:hypothetical protein
MGPVTTQEKGPQYSENRRLVEPTAGLDVLEYRILLFLPVILGCWSAALSFYRLRFTGSIMDILAYQNNMPFTKKSRRLKHETLNREIDVSTYET